MFSKTVAFFLFLYLIWPTFSADFVPSERLVLIDTGEEQRLLAEMKERRVSLRKLKSSQPVYLLSFSHLNISENDIDELLQRMEFGLVEKNFIYKVQSTPNDLYFPFQWSMKNEGPLSPLSNAVTGVDIALLDAWQLATGKRDLKVAVIDTGIDYRHHELKENIWINHLEENGAVGVDDDGNGYIDDIHGYNVIDHNGDPMDRSGHGTHCAGIIGARSDNGMGIAGILKEVSLIAIKAFSDSGLSTSASSIEAVTYAIEVESDIISSSWGGAGFSQLLKNEIIVAKDHGIVFVAAAGNSGRNNDDHKTYPADYDVENIITVASHSQTGNLASNSNYGVNNVDIAAPGTLIYSTLPEDKFGYLSGTSMAAPHVTGAIGLLLDYEGKIDFEDIKTRLIETAIPVPSFLGKIRSGGRLNLDNLLRNLPTEIERPDENSWLDFQLAEPFESEHPYSDDLVFEREIHIPGAKFLKVEIAQMDLENYFDFLKIYNGEGVFLEKLSGQLQNHHSLLIAGDKIKLRLETDFAETRWGIKIEKILWQ